MASSGESDAEGDQPQPVESITARDYQVQLAEFAKHSNCVVYLPTGSGKTFIATLLIRNYLDRIRGPFADSQRVVFVAPNTSLTTQQSRYLARHLPVPVEFYIGSKGVDTWNRDYWLAEFDAASVLVMTPAILHQLLSVRTLPLEKLACVIFDEAHWAACSFRADGTYTQTKHFYNQILELIAAAPAGQRPRLLGLTASLINRQCKLTEIKFYMRFLEKVYAARCVSSSESNLYSPDMRITYWQYANRALGMHDLRLFLVFFVNTFDRYARQAPCPKQFLLEETTEEECLESDKVVWLCFEQLLYYFSSLQYVLERLGVWCCWRLVQLLQLDLGRRLKLLTANQTYGALLAQVQTVLEFLSAMLRQMLDRHGWPQAMVELSSPQLARLLEVLLFQQETLKDRFRCLVFVQRRISSVLVSDFLNEAGKQLPQFAYLRSDHIIGRNSGDHFFRQSIAHQNLVIDRFREDQINTLVSTSILEEGIDVPQCNLVVRYDSIATFREWIQSKGRARFEKSNFILINGANERKAYLAQVNEFLKIERYLEDQCFLKEDHSQLEIREARAPVDHEPPLRSKTGAAIQAKQAFFTVSNYCNKCLGQKGYPKYKIVQVAGAGGGFRCRVFLPNKSLLMEPVDGQVRASKERARDQAMLEVCSRLYQLGELEETLLPKRREKVAAEFVRKQRLTLFDQVGQEESRELFERKQTASDEKEMFGRLVCEKDYFKRKRDAGEPNSWHLYRLQFETSDPDFTRSGPLDAAVGFLSGVQLPAECNLLPLFNQHYEIKVRPTLVGQLTVPQAELRKLQFFHCAALQRLFAHRLNQKELDSNFQPEADPLFLLVPLREQRICWEAVSRLQKQLPWQTTYQNGSVVSTKYIERMYVVTKKHSGRFAHMRFGKQQMSYVEHFRNNHKLELREPNEELLELQPCNLQHRARLNQQELRLDRTAREPIHLPPELCFVEQFSIGFFKQLACICPLLYRVKQVISLLDLRADLLLAVFNVDEQPAPRSAEQTLANQSTPSHSAQKRTQAEMEEGRLLDSQLDITCCQPFVGGDDQRSPAHLATGSTNLAVGVSEQTPPRNPRPIRTVDPHEHRQLSTASKAQIVQLYNEQLSLALAAKHLKFDAFARAVDLLCQQHLASFAGKRPQPSAKKNRKQKESDKTKRELTQEEQMDFNHWSADCSQRNAEERLIRFAYLQEAFTPLVARDTMNLERLEIAGDSFLKLTVCNHLFHLCRGLDEGKMVLLKDRIVSNLNLFNLAGRRRLQRFIFALELEPFDNWLPDGFALEDAAPASRRTMLEKQPIRPKTIADSLEALIGGTLLTSGMLSTLRLMRWLGVAVDLDRQPLGPDTAQADWFPRFDGILNENLPREAAEELVAELYAKGSFSQLEQQLGYEFKQKALLVKAFTHQGFHANTVTGSYETLEFLGDSVVDYLVTRFLLKRLGDGCTPGQITNIRSAVVNNFYFGCLVVKHQLHQFFLMEDYAVTNDVHAFADYCAQHLKPDEVIVGDFVVLEQLRKVSFVDVKAPKVLGDLFESLVGALYLDSGLDLVQVWRVIYPLMRTEIQYFSRFVPRNYITHVTELYPLARFEKVAGASKEGCRMQVEADGRKFTGVGQNRCQAKLNAAKHVIQHYLHNHPKSPLKAGASPARL